MCFRGDFQWMQSGDENLSSPSRLRRIKPKTKRRKVKWAMKFEEAKAQGPEYLVIWLQSKRSVLILVTETLSPLSASLLSPTAAT
jgi:hypothetical protein